MNEKRRGPRAPPLRFQAAVCPGPPVGTILALTKEFRMPIARRLATVALAATLGLGLLAACSNDSSGKAAGTTSRTAATTTTVVNAPPSTPGCQVPVVPTVQAICYKQGTAHVEVSGAVVQTLDVPINPKNAIAHFPSPDQMIIGYVGGNGAKVLVVGNTIEGTYPSKLPWAIGIWTAAPTRYFYAASGECRITVTTATQQKIEGSFTCKKVPEDKGSGTIDATGTYVATP